MKITREVEIQQPKQKVGRNDPCFCGSGKKYKKCCLLKEQAPEFVSSDKARDLIGKLAIWAQEQDWYQREYQKIADRIDMVAAGVAETKEEQILEEMLFFEVKVQGGKTGLELFLLEGSMNDADRKIYKSWVKSPFGAYVVAEVFLGKGMVVQELPSGKELLISEHLASYSLQKGIVVASRVLPFPGGNMFAGGFLSQLPEQVADALRTGEVVWPLTLVDYLVASGRMKEEEVAVSESSYEALKAELAEIVVEQEVPFAMADFDKRIREAKNMTAFFYPVLLAALEEGDEDLPERINRVTYSLWIKALDEKGVKRKKEMEAIGEREESLIREFSQYCARRFEDEEIIDPDEQLRVSAEWREEWLDTTQKELRGEMPRQVILRERMAAGNKQKDFGYASTGLIWSKRWDEASKLHFASLEALRRGEMRKAYEGFGRVVEEYADFPFLFRTVANWAMAALGLGNKQEAIELLERACSMNVHYRFARKELARVKGLSEKKVREMAEGAKLLEEPLGRLIKMVERAKKGGRK